MGPRHISHFVIHNTIFVTNNFRLVSTQHVKMWDYESFVVDKCSSHKTRYFRVNIGVCAIHRWAFMLHPTLWCPCSSRLWYLVFAHLLIVITHLGFWITELNIYTFYLEYHTENVQSWLTWPNLCITGLNLNCR